MIATARLRLRPWREDERAGFAAILNTPAMMAHHGGVRSAAEMDALFAKRLNDQARHGFSYWAVELHDGGLVGSCGLRIADNYPGTPVAGMHELGWRIADRHWRKGLAREAAGAVIDWAWRNTDAPFLAAWTIPANEGSWRLMERLDMTRRPDLVFRDPRGRYPVAFIVYTIDRP